ncbi:MAG: lipid-A-disaccharide synthase [Gammaproteobacteria bacterium]|nr:lipid-A-disaccharide synthase [Gammaproteobacteria bacterium]MCP5135323.1 lipid-A-disaccharide synthase [Gammaproteobacteria bacterium]
MKIGIVAGEHSGDQLGAALIRALRARDPNVEIIAMAGPRMREAGCDAIHDIDELSVMGFTEVIRHLPRLLRLRRRLTCELIERQIDVLVGIDVPDFALGLEKRVKAAGIPAVHYVSPSVWAWRKGRIHAIKDSVSHMLTLFPFETAIYEQHGVPVTCVGHPLAKEIPIQVDAAEARRTLGLEGDEPLLAMLPGSRGFEVEQLIDLFLDAATALQRALPDLRFVIPAASAKRRASIDAALSGRSLPVTVVDGQAHQAMAAADAVVLASGTATLEAALLHRPMVVAYRFTALSWFIYTLLGIKKIPHYALPNLLAGEGVAPELIQENLNVSSLVEASLPLLTDPDARARQTEAYQRIHAELSGDASAVAAEVVLRVAGQSRC